MDCRDFRKNHVAFVDDLLPGVDMVAMQLHLHECETCARHDMLVRRSLLVVRNVPMIEPSADFSARLNARLRECRAMDAMASGGEAPVSRTLLAAAASILLIGYLALSTSDWMQPQGDVVLEPAIAYEPAPPTPPLANPAVVASSSAGMPIWSSMLVAEQASAQFAAEFRLANWTR